MTKRKTIHQYLLVSGIEVPVQIIKEARPNARFSLTQKCAILRLPWNISRQSEQQTLEWFLEVLASRIESNPELKLRFVSRGYTDGQQIQVGATQYKLHLLFEDRRSVSGKRIDLELYLKISLELSGAALQKAIKSTLSKLIADHQLPAIQKRLEAINRESFGHKIKEVKIRYLQSRWGSCSSTGNITLSSRLLFAPPGVIDYVIIHELSHLSVFDHSPAFWNCVRKVMPDYTEKEDWLKKYGNQCQF